MKNMDKYIKLYILKNNKIQLEQLFLNDLSTKDKLIRYIGQIFDGFCIEDLVNKLINNLDISNYTIFDIFSHICEIHIFQLNQNEKDFKFIDLINIYDPIYINNIIMIPNNTDSDSDSDYNDNNCNSYFRCCFN